MLKPYTNECVGFTTDTDVMRELGLTFPQFKRFVMQGNEYRGCILIEDESNSFNADKFEIEYRLIEETERGTRYYATNDLHIVSIFKNGNRKVLKPKNLNILHRAFKLTVRQDMFTERVMKRSMES